MDEAEELRRLLAWRDRVHKQSTRRWIAAAKSALKGDLTDLAERVALAEGAGGVVELPGGRDGGGT